MSKRKKSPLAWWKVEYQFASMNIKDLKTRIKNDEFWGAFKGSHVSPERQQTMLVAAKRRATDLMHQRFIARDNARRLSALNSARRDAAINGREAPDAAEFGIGHNSNIAQFVN